MENAEVFEPEYTEEKPSDGVYVLDGKGRVVKLEVADDENDQA